jgi:acetyl/propionyl-CoA carboxylase alpha subunit
MKYITTINEQDFTIEIIDERHITVNGVAYEVDFESVSGQPVYSLLLNGNSYEAHVYPSDEGLQVLLHGNFYLANVEDERERRLRAAAGGLATDNREFLLKSPMPGLVVAVMVEEGQTVDKGDVLVILESMKMQNELKSPRAGTIGRVRVGVGQTVEQKQTLLAVA